MKVNMKCEKLKIVKQKNEAKYKLNQLNDLNNKTDIFATYYNNNFNTL